VRDKIGTDGRKLCQGFLPPIIEPRVHPATIQISIGERVIDSDTDTASKREDRIRELEAGLSRLTAKLSNPTERMMLAAALGSQQRFKADEIDHHGK
jgi:hypothetical protein